MEQLKGDTMSALKNNDSFEVHSDDYAYGRKSVAKLETSTTNLSKLQKTIIKMSLEYDIIDIRTYAGYKGDLIVQIIAESKETLHQLKTTSKRLGMQSVLKKNHAMMTFELYCISTNANPAYVLK